MSHTIPIIPIEDEQLLVNAEDLLCYLRMLGFGLGCWFYSSNDLEQPETKTEIETSVARLLKLNEGDSKYLTELLIRYSLNFSKETVERVRKECHPHSLDQFIEGATDNKLLCNTKLID